jgi:hypothetical protein
MPEYLDAAVVRIQPYIARTPELSLRRGASWMITKATGDAAVDAWIRDSGVAQVARNPEAGHADGVVTVTVLDGTAESHARRLLLHLRQSIPGADLQASWGQAATYLEFRRNQPPDGPGLRALPPVADFPLAETCESCRVDARDRSSEMCADCAARAAVAGHRRARPRPGRQETAGQEVDALGTERLVIDTVSQALGRKLRPARDMGDVAGLGDEFGNRNHVATVALDGNGMGGFFAALASHEDASIKKRISPEISAATRTALISAATAVARETDRFMPVIPHVLGGDDVVISVTADRAWPFTRAFLDGFATAMQAAAERLALPGPLRQRLPSMSAGVVFAHAKFPYARAVRLAEDALRRAKRDTRGAEPAVSWLDVTADGEVPPAWRLTQTMDALSRRADDITALGGIPASGRQALARLLARGTDEESQAAALSWARRNDHPVVAALLETSSVTEVRNLLALTRWWRS